MLAMWVEQRDDAKIPLVLLMSNILSSKKSMPLWIKLRGVHDLDSID